MNAKNRKSNPDLLAEAEQRYRILMKLSPYPIVILQDEHCRFVNPAFTRVFGYTQRDFDEGTRYLDIIHERHRDRVRKEYRKRVTGRPIPRTYFMDLISKQGRVVNCQSFGTLIPYKGRPADLFIIVDVTRRKEAEKALRLAHDELEKRVEERTKELEAKSRLLEEVNAALRVLLKRRDEDRSELGANVLFNTNQRVLPYLEKLKASGLNDGQKAVVALLESNLGDVVSPFYRALTSRYLNLTPAETQVTSLIRQGKPTKEIAALLHLSRRTIEYHRDNIRRKLGIKQKKENLMTHLLSMQ